VWCGAWSLNPFSPPLSPRHLFDYYAIDTDERHFKRIGKQRWVQFCQVRVSLPVGPHKPTLFAAFLV